MTISEIVDMVPYLFAIGMLSLSALIFVAIIVFLAVDQDQP